MRYDVKAVYKTLSDIKAELGVLRDSGTYAKSFAVHNAVMEQLENLGYAVRPMESSAVKDWAYVPAIHHGNDIKRTISIVTTFLRKLEFLSPTETGVDEKEIPGEVMFLLIHGINPEAYLTEAKLQAYIDGLVNEAVETGSVCSDYHSFHSVSPKQPEVIPAVYSGYILPSGAVVQEDNLNITPSSTTKAGFTFFVVGCIIALLVIAFN